MTGISSIDGYDASENETTSSEDFKNNQWYRFRVRVEPEKLLVWINDRVFVSVDREGKKFSTRIEVDKSRPLGYCNFQCQAAIRRWEYRSLVEAKVNEKPKAGEATSTGSRST